MPIHGNRLNVLTSPVRCCHEALGCSNVVFDRGTSVLVAELACRTHVVR
jgi:hypothetical protein